MLQVQTAALFKAILPAEFLAWHTPNGEKRDKLTASLLKAMGVLPGVLDWLFLCPDGKMAALELKSATGDLTEGQRDFIAEMTKRGLMTGTARTPEEAAAFVCRLAASYGLKPRGRLS